MAERFVILRHVGHGEDHYDLMFADGDVLATWQVPVSPVELSAGESVPAVQLPDHRLAYLAYEGPVSGGRGRVSRACEGTYDNISRDKDCWMVAISSQAGECVRLELRVAPIGQGKWRITRRND